MRVEIWANCNIRKTHIRIRIKEKNFGLKEKTYQSKIQNQIEKEIPFSLARSLSLSLSIYYIHTRSTLNLSLSLWVFQSLRRSKNSLIHTFAFEIVLAYFDYNFSFFVGCLFQFSSLLVLFLVLFLVWVDLGFNICIQS